MKSILFTADNHLRDSQWSRRDRATDFQNALTDIIDTAIRDRVAAICVSGDLLDQIRPSPQVFRYLKRQNRRLERAAIPLYVTAGDHDKTDPHWTTQLKEEGDPRRCGIILLDNELVTVPGTDLTIYGLTFITKTKEGHDAVWATLPDATILLMHSTVQEFCKFPTANALRLDDLPRVKFNVISIGDIHVHESAYLDDETLVLSPGSTELCKTNEPLEKFCYLVDFSNPTKPLEAQSVPIKTRKALRYTINTEEQMQAAVADLQTHATEAPIVIYTFNPAVENVAGRFGMIVDAEVAIMRGCPNYGEIRFDGAVEEDDEEHRTTADFLPIYIPVESRLFSVAESLLSPEAPANDIIDAFIAARTAEIEKSA
jgi:DNA repair exonuclease SbcCD nuclease subunit